MTTATTADQGQPDSLGIAVPREWVQLPVERTPFDQFCTEMRATWADELGWDRTTQRQAELLLGRIRRDVVRAGIQFVAMYVASNEEAADPGPAELEGAAPRQDPLADEVLMATCTVGTYSRESLRAKLPLTLGNLAMAFGRRADEPDTGERQYKSIVNLDPPAIHQLPIGTSIRLRRLYELHEPGLLPQRFYAETYLTPADPAGETCTIAQFTTINLPLAPIFSELFESIAGTITHFRDADPTEFESEWVDSLREE